MARPREFEPDDALKTIQRTFWARGYHGTSMQDLEKATGLKKQSLYRQFGNKDAMYRHALELYGDQDVSRLAEVISRAPTARERFEDLFAAVLEPVRNGDRSGCFLCNSAIDRADEDPPTRETATEGIAGTLDMFDRALSISEPYASDASLCHDTAMVLTAGYFGLRVMVRSGTALHKLQETADALARTVRT